MHLAQTTGPRREILCEGKYRPPIHQAVAGDHAVCRDVNRFHSKIDAAVTDEHVDFAECTFIEQQIQTLTGSQFAFLTLAGNGFLAAHFQ